MIRDNDFVPVPSRKTIENQNMFKEYILAYIDDPALAYFLHIQGSGLITLPSGETMAVSYAGDNGKDYYSIGKKLIEDGIDIILAGLDMDYKGEPFGSMPKLLSISHDVKKMHAVCFDCGETANYTFRINNDTQQVLIGSEENYKALCKDCFFK